MELIFRGKKEDIEKFVNEVIYPVIYQRQRETEGHYFRFTEDKGDYYSRDPKAGNKVRRIKGYFPGKYYAVDFYADKYKDRGGEEMTLFEIREMGDKLEALKNNLFAVKAAIYHGEIENAAADDALAFIVESLEEIAKKIQNVSMKGEEEEE